VLKHLRATSRPVRLELLGDDVAERLRDTGGSPLLRSMEHEDVDGLCRAYVLMLSMYIDAYGELSTREQQALHLVEVVGACYRDSSRALSIKVENLKMIVFRARRKMYRSMRRRFASAGVSSGIHSN
jgi:DNA-directed RNA polymerase specialized sigma24 family protein